LDTEYFSTVIVLDAALPTYLWSENMCQKILKQFVFWIFTIFVASIVSTAAMAQTNVLPIGPEAVEVQVRQQWKDSEANCENSSQAKIDHVDIISGYEFKNWLMTRHSIYGDRVELFPKGSYVRVASHGEPIGDGIAAFGPVYNTAKPTNFRNIVGLPICNFNAQKPNSTQLKVGK
jgi:hypothetical protein